jgi:SAM-dependent methyltransferase
LRWLGELLRRMRPELGFSMLAAAMACRPREIAEGFDATGIDISAAQIERARRNVPGARFVQADLVEIDFKASFAGIAAFYVIEHVPRDLHAEGLRALSRLARTRAATWFSRSSRMSSVESSAYGSESRLVLQPVRRRHDD